MDNMSVDGNMNGTQRVRAWLGKLPAKEISFDNISPLAKQVGLETDTFRNSLKYLEKIGEISIYKTTSPKGRIYWTGLSLVKAVPSTAVYDEVVEQTIKKIDPIEPVKIDSSRTPYLERYIKQKTALQQAQNILGESGIDPERVAAFLEGNFEKNTFAEEAIYLLGVIDMQNMQITSIANQRDNAALDASRWTEKAKYWEDKARHNLPVSQFSKFEENAPWNKDE